MSKRFDYVQYDKNAMDKQAVFKQRCVELDIALSKLGAGRHQEFAAKALEEFYMWVGKAIRDEQIERNGGKAPLQEGRTNS